MRVSFGPLRPDAVQLLSWAIEVDYSPAKFDDPRWLCTTARRDDDQLMGVAVFECKAPFEAYFALAIVDPRCISRRIMRAMFSAIFSRVVRVTAEIDPNNQPALRQVRLMGFVYEGFKRRGLDGNRDAMLFGMLREDCRYLPGYHPARTSMIPLALGGQHGQSTNAS